MKGLLTKDFLTIRKKYGIPRVAMDIFIIVALKGQEQFTLVFYLSRLKLCQWLCHWQPATNNGSGENMPFLYQLPKRRS